MHKLLLCSKILYDHDMGNMIQKINELERENKKLKDRNIILEKENKIYKTNILEDPVCRFDFETEEQWNNFFNEKFNEFEKDIEELVKNEFIARKHLRQNNNEGTYDYITRRNRLGEPFFQVFGLEDIIHKLFYSISNNDGWALDKAMCISGTIKGMLLELDDWHLLLEMYEEDCITEVICSTVRNLFEDSMKDIIYFLVGY